MHAGREDFSSGIAVALTLLHDTKFLLWRPFLLCSSQLGTDISGDEAKEAVRILDESKTGYIQFGDFVEWYQGRRPRKETKEAAVQASQ